MYAIVDIETTGGHASANGITEIAIYIHDGEKITDTFKSLINPRQPVPLYITSLTGISNAMVAGAPLFEEVAERIYEMLRGNVFVAHNVNFDFSFLKHQLKSNGYDLNEKKLCTVRLSRKIFPGLSSYSLGNLCRNLSIEIENRHRADGDAAATVTLFNRILDSGGISVINDMLKRTSGEQWLPVHLEKRIIDNLPAGPGVYYFHDSKGKIIYVGKAVNIRKRVSSHFTHNDGNRRRQHFLRYIYNITCNPCSSELHALVLESTEIRRLWPKYNYSQKQPVIKYGLYAFEDSRGYTRLALDRKKKNVPALYQCNMLHEGMVLLRRMVDEFGLDERLCYIDKSPPASDFVCSPAEYNEKVKQAVCSLQQKLPTFAIVDEGLTPDQKLCLLIEKGSFWGMGYIHAHDTITDIYDLKEKLHPHQDNDLIRNSIYSFAAEYPDRKVLFSDVQSLA